MTLVKHLEDGRNRIFIPFQKAAHTAGFHRPNYYTSTSPDRLSEKENRAAEDRDGSIVNRRQDLQKKVGKEVYEEEITTNKRLYEILTQEFNMIVPKMTFSTDFPREWF
jgi:N-hydroxyarylamine O-acetyltransferase